jgi:hypothetical protein
MKQEEYGFWEAPRALVKLEDKSEVVVVLVSKTITLDDEVKRLFPTARSYQKTSFNRHMIGTWHKDKPK